MQYSPGDWACHLDAHRATFAGVALPYTQPWRPVSGFAIAALVLGIMGRAAGRDLRHKAPLRVC
ncbi:hypothetical protein [Mycobacterium decipiens]|uniref:hypothetical protein n=1 Tax=Mycobacterium decipiens TaxID=1430326 RepID=UPI0010565552|nr:hypothetical protein [Mycobacterium decipiens]